MTLRQQFADSRRLRASMLFVAMAAAVSIWVLPLRGQRGQPGPPVRLDSPRDMNMKITDPFTVASVGDLIIMRPTSQLQEPGFQAAIKIIRDADLGVGNFESNASDMLRFNGPMRGFMGTKETPADVKAMGFDLVNRANNHAPESTEVGMMATNDLVEEAGLVYAGAGKNLDDARAARFLETPKGRVGFVGMTTLGFNPQASASASYRVGNTGGKPGVSGVGLTRYQVVTPEQIAALRKVRDAVYQHRNEYANAVDPLPANESLDQLDLFGTRYKVGDKPGRFAYEMNPSDLRDILRSVRNGKQYADFMVATIHTHDLNSSLVKAHLGEEPPDFYVELARKAIDNGADIWVGHGVHVLRGIEIYKGKPIFYGLGEFFRQMDWTIYPTRPEGDMTDAELAVQNWSRLQLPINYDTAIAQTRYEKGRLQEVRLYPIVGGQDGPISRRGIPRMAPPEDGRRILGKLQELSKAFGTVIAIEGNVGVIRVAGTAPATAQP
jgi:poly-gamma-glutamate capsule biosynthesis protein CapA/YwtB (metallophosphatase superfamily)